MASPPPEAGLTDYERLREENIRRNDAILASLRRKAADLSASLRPTPSCPKRAKKEPPPRTAPASPVVLRRSLRTRGLPPSDSSAADAASPASPPSPPMPRTTRFSSSLASALRSAAADASPSAPEGEIREADGFDAGRDLMLRPADVRRVVPERILSVRVLPLADRTVVVAGNKVGHIGFWDVDGIVEDGDSADGVFEYFPHRGPVGAIVAHPATPRKIYSCSYEGEICLMDVEKEIFNMIQLCDYPVFSLCQAPNSPSCLYFGEGNGELKLFDERAGKVSTTWNLHDNRINSIDFHLENPYIFATSSTDRTACMWDMRSMKKKGPESLKVFEHDRSVQSAYFSPSSSMLATTSLDDTVRVFNVDNFDDSYIIKHYNQTGRWLSTFKAIWSWNSTDIFIGNMKRAIDVISVDRNESGVSASSKACLESEHMTAIPCRFSLHPYKVGHLACASSGGKVFLWTRA
ncbi:DNA damage-binding protein cmr1-like [Phragmites australis]|uniref:DNA damage-binding protein cmr1-like n=1 Tax=Phragmites australis TaxID=29695 RepID=UPI002D77B51F|nr:DNA damage-binding protein cmr1-like [Phragmites australis]